MDPEIKKLACGIVVKAYEHHKNHARFEETQRAWMVAAYFTFTGFLYIGVIFKEGSQECAGMLSLSRLATIGLLSHIVVGVLAMISSAKVSGEFTRHFSTAEKILAGLAALANHNSDLQNLLNIACLETAVHEPSKPWSGWLTRLLSNAAIHNYLFAFLTAVDIYLLSGCVTTAGIWFAVLSFLSYCYVGFIVRRVRQQPNL